MTKPVSLSLDFTNGVGYVRYRDPRANEQVSGARLGDHVDVVVDRDPTGGIVGIELLGLDDETLAIADGFAQQNGLGFPRARLQALEPA